MKAVLISIQPKWCNLIAKGKKTVEVRKTKPKLETPFKCYIYETKGIGETPQFIDEDGHVSYRGRGQVIGEFVCDKIEEFTVGGLRCDDIEVEACLTHEEMIAYFYKPEELDGKHAKFGYCWHISDLKIYDEPKELSEFYAPCEKCIEQPFCQKFHNGYDREADCYNIIDRPPQSWCYVEELK